MIDIVVGAEHSLALSEDGRVWAWGNNSHGQLGLNPKVLGAYVHQPTVVPDLSPDKCILQVFLSLFLFFVKNCYSRYMCNGNEQEATSVPNYYVSCSPPESGQGQNLDKRNSTVWTSPYW